MARPERPVACRSRRRVCSLGLGVGTWPDARVADEHCVCCGCVVLQRMYSALMNACSISSGSSIVAYLLNRGANVDYVTVRGGTSVAPMPIPAVGGCVALAVAHVVIVVCCVVLDVDVVTHGRYRCVHVAARLGHDTPPPGVQAGARAHCQPVAQSECQRPGSGCTYPALAAPGVHARA